MNKITYILSLLLVVITFASCSKDYLEVDPIGSVSSENFLNTEDEVRQAMIGVYDIIQHNYSNGGWASVYFMKNLPADDCLAAGGSTTDQTDYQRIDDFQIETDNAKIESIWTNFYKTINFCNTIINQVSARTDATTAMNQMVGEAKAIRAFTYLELVTIFGGVPLMTVNPVNSDDFHKPRATEAEIYAQIETDLTEAIAVLPTKAEYSDADKFRFSKGAAQATLGKAYLYQEKYSDAATVLGALITTGEYDLEPNFEDVWSETHEFGIESLFETSYTSQESYDWGNFPWGGGNENNIEVQLEGPRDLYFDVSESSLDVVNGWGFNLPSQEIGDLFIAEGETSRYNGTLISAADFEATGGVILAIYNNPEDPDNPNDHDYEGYMRLKYVTKASASSTVGVRELNYTINWRLIRYADVLLMAAEAYHLSGNDAAAQTELAKVRNRAGFAGSVTETGAALFTLIKKERQIELAFEGSRFWDLVRWGDADAELSDIGFESGKHEHFPIPQNEIIANNAIDETDQNPGY